MSEAPEDLVEAATAVRENAIATFSKFKVGSALRVGEEITPADWA